MCDAPSIEEHEAWSLRVALATVTTSDFDPIEAHAPLGEVLDDIKARGGDPWGVIVCAARDLARALEELYDGPPEEWVQRKLVEHLDGWDEEES